MFFDLVFCFINIFFIFLSTAFLTLLERKILSLSGLRLGPNKVLFYGIFQPICDAIKLSSKQVNDLMNASFFFFYFISLIILIFSLILWSFNSFLFFMSVKSTFILIVMILGFNSVLLLCLGWSSFSKFSFLGSIRTIVLLISYEPVIYFIILSFILFFASFSVSSFFYSPPSLFFFFFFFFFFWLFSVLVELNRTPYDFSEGESELVSGFNTEFGSSCFTIIFLGEYMNIIFFSFFSCVLFFFYFSIIFSFFFIIFIVWSRCLLPRYRFDKLIFISWKFYIPFVTLFFSFFIVL